MKMNRIDLWKGRRDVRLHSYIMETDSMAVKRVKRPAVIVLPGGGYNSANPHSVEGEPVALAFAMDGYQAFVLEYSVRGRVPEEDMARFPAQLIDVGKSILLIREKAEEWNIDPDKIAVIGFSAGGHLAGLYGTAWDDPMVYGALGCEPEMIRPMAVIMFYAQSDLHILLDDDIKRAKETGEFSGILRRQGFLMGEDFPSPDSLDKWSPARRVSQNTPPMFLVSAQNDTVVNPVQTLMMARALQETGVPYELHMFQNGGHAFGIGNDVDEPFLLQKKHEASQWIELSKRFLLRIIDADSCLEEKEGLDERIRSFLKL